MPITRALFIPLLAVGTLGTMATAPNRPASAHHETTLRCRLVPGRTLALLRVERDTMLPFAPSSAGVMSSSSGAPGDAEQSIATRDTPMPAARVRLLQVDSVTRDVFVRAGITDAQPVAFIRAAPYRADCRTVRWTDSVPWVQAGDVGYARATLAAREDWIDGVPVLVIPDVWDYPYPRRRGLAYDVAPEARLAPAEAMYSLYAALEAPGVSMPDTARRARALAWIQSHRTEAELEPVRTLVRRAVLDVDRQEAFRMPSRLRGTYRVTIESDSARGTWYFRTHDRPGYRWPEADSALGTAELLASPHIAGTRLVGYAASTADALLTASPSGRVWPPLVWLAATDRPTAPGNDARRALRGVLEFQLSATPTALWEQLEAFVPPLRPIDSTLLARIGRQIPRADRQSRLPLTVRIDAAGGVHADTSLTVGGQRLRVSLERIDTLSVRRPF